MAEECIVKTELQVPASRVWKAAFEEGQSFLPKASSHAIERVEYEGGGFVPGSVRTVHFQKNHAEKVAAEKHPGKVVLLVKERLEAVDAAGRRLKASVIEGGFQGILVKEYKYGVRVVETGPASCVVEWKFEYVALNEEVRPHVTAALHEVVPLGFDDVGRYLVDHPDEYN